MQTDRGKKWNEIRMRLFKMVSVGVVDDPINQGYDIVSTLMLIVNLIGAFANTFDGVRAQYASLLDLTEEITVAFFALDYALRLVTAKCLYPQLTEGRALAKYMLSAGGIVDLLSFLPFYLPFFFPSGAAAFRLFRVARIFRLFRINAYYDSLNVITEVIVGKKQQLLSSVFIILVLMLGSSLCMYSLEHDAQPEVFKNAFSGVWWSVSTLLTIGYGDIYPITPAGKAMGIFITFLGVGMVAIPTGIISAGFVEQYTRLKRLGDYAEEEDLHFIKTELHRGDLWVGKTVRELHLPQGVILAVIQRGGDTIIPLCPFPIGDTMSTIRMAIPLPSHSIRRRSFGKTGVISSKFLRFAASAGVLPLMVFKYSKALNFSCWVLILVLPIRISPVFNPKRRIWDGDTYTSFSPGR